MGVMKSPPSSRRPRHALSWLGGEPGFERLRERVRRLADLQQDLERYMPGTALKAVSLEDGVLVVSAAQASAAAKVRQFGPSLVAELSRQGWRVQRVRFKPRLVAGSAPRRAPKAPLAPGAAASVAALAESVSNPALREALKRMAARHGR
jgi:hypothetical protein